MRKQKTVGAVLRAARQLRGWTQADLSHYSRMSSADISRIETGRLIPTPSQRERLADVLGLSRDEVVST